MCAAQPVAGPREDELLHKIMFRTAKAFRSPMVVLSIELRDRRRIVGHLRLHEPPGASHFWPALQQVSSTREPLVIPDITKHSLFGYRVAGTRARGTRLRDDSSHRARPAGSSVR